MTPRSPRRALYIWWGLVALPPGAACLKGSNQPLPGGAVTPESHSWVPITAGTEHAIGRVMADGTIACESCHAPANADFKQWTCVGCHTHEQAVTGRLHLGRPNEYTYDSSACYSCHPNGNKIGFSHFG